MSATAMTATADDIVHVWAAWMLPAVCQSAVLLALVAIIDRLLRRRLAPLVLQGMWAAALLAALVPAGVLTPVTVARPVGVALGRAADAAAAVAPAATGAALLAIWVAGVVVCGTRAMLRERRLTALLARTALADAAGAGGRLGCRVAMLAARVGLRRVPEVVVTTAVASPAVRGWWTPQILIPVAMATAADATLDAMLLHELIHVRRRDLLTVAVAEALAIVHWFNPLFRLAVTRVRALNEFGCDAAVVALPGAEAAGYRHVLLEHAAALAGVQTAPADLRLATAFAGPGAEIVARLQALERARPGARPPKLAAAAAAMLTLACVAPMGRLPGPAVSAGSGAAVTCGDAPFTQQARDTLDRHLAGERVGCLRLRAAAVQLWNPATQDFDQGTQP